MPRKVVEPLAPCPECGKPMMVQYVAGIYCISHKDKNSSCGVSWMSYFCNIDHVKHNHGHIKPPRNRNGIRCTTAKTWNEWVKSESEVNDGSEFK